MKDFHITLRLSHPLLYDDRPTIRYAEATIRSSAAPETRGRPAMNLAIVLDRSGSMWGEKIARAKQAAMHILERLNESDRVALVMYDDQIDVLASSSPATPDHLTRCRRRLEEIPAGGTTNLCDGWLTGCDQVAEAISRFKVNRVLLLTDGLANVGITDPDSIATHTRNLRERGVVTSTFGIGADFDEDLLAQMADAGGGRFRYIEHAGLIPSAFREEFGDLASVVAKGASLTLTFPEGIRVETLGGIPFEASNGQIVIPVGDLYGGEERPYYFRMKTEAEKTGTVLVVRAKLNTLSGSPVALETSASLTYATASGVDAAPQDDDLVRRVADVDVADARMEAMSLNRMGEFHQAGEILRSRSRLYSGVRAADLLKADEMVAAMAQSPMESGDRKDVQYRAYRSSRMRRKSEDDRVT